MSELTASPVFGVVLTLAAYALGVFIQRKTKLPVFNPLLIAIILIILTLKLFQIQYDHYANGGQVISFFLYPITIALALPMHKHFSLLMKNFMPMMIGILCGNLSGMVFIFFCARLMGFSDELTKSLLPKSVTTPIGMVISAQLGAIQSVTVVAIILTGIAGSIIGPMLYKLLRMKDEVAFGIAMGTSSHAIGTAKALEIGELPGAMSGVSMALSGIITVFLAPLFWRIFSAL